jgi:hypothetical protein
LAKKTHAFATMTGAAREGERQEGAQKHGSFQLPRPVYVIAAPHEK